MHVPLTEIFSSAQGEGPMVGCRQLFLRFAGCNLTCSYCDTPLVPGKEGCKIEYEPGSNGFTYLPWPITIKQVIETVINKFNLSNHHSISITGGEPLQHYQLLKEMLPMLKGTRKGIFLETNGTLYDELKQIIEHVDIISMDIKLPSTAKISPRWDAHREFIKVAVNNNTYFYIKLVVSDQTPMDELRLVWGLIRDYAPGVTVIIQPVTPYNGIGCPSIGQLLDWQLQAMDYIDDVRIISQTHRAVGML